MDNKIYSDIYNDFFGKKNEIKTIDINKNETEDIALIYKKILPKNILGRTVYYLSLNY